MDWYSYIEAYHRGILSDSIRADFEQAMADDADLKEAVDAFEAIEPALDLLLEEDIRQQMHTLNVKSPLHVTPVSEAKVRPIVKNWRALVGVAAAVALLAVFFWPSSESYTIQEGKQMVFEYHPPGTRGQTPNKENLDLGEFYFFEVQRFIQFDQADSALYFLNELDKLESQDNSETDYYRAVAHYLKGDFKETRASLKPLLDDPSNDFHEMAKTFAKVLSRTKE